MESIPKTIGKYKIKGLLGEGAMGVVYEGIDAAIDRRVAIKTLHTHLIDKTNGKEFLQRFKREASSAARCTHPNIVMVLEYGEDAGKPFIAMEYIDGSSLQEIINSGKKISINNTLSIISQLLKAIHSAHQLGVIHRDIKTANIMLCKNSHKVKLADFGIARFTDNLSITLTGVVVGTPRYMAPEQMFGLKSDERADLFSIAMVFTELLAALPDRSTINLTNLPVLEGLPQNNKINYSCLYPEALIPVLKKGLTSKPSERFQSAKEFASAIQMVIPQLRKEKPISNDTTRVYQQINENDSIISQDLDSLTNILSEYIGPIARNVMKERCTQHATLSNLVTAVSEEIPAGRQREEFISDWEKQLRTTNQSRSGSQSSRSQNSQSSRGSSIRLDENTIQKISNDFVNYIGPFAPRLVDYYCQESPDKDHFIYSLANEIPDQKSRNEFIKKWSLI